MPSPFPKQPYHGHLLADYGIPAAIVLIGATILVFYRSEHGMNQEMETIKSRIGNETIQYANDSLPESTRPQGGHPPCQHQPSKASYDNACNKTGQGR